MTHDEKMMVFAERDEADRLAMKLPNGMRTWDLYWSPEGKQIDTVQARTYKAALRKAPMPYRRFLGEIYAITTD